MCEAKPSALPQITITPNYNYPNYNYPKFAIMCVSLSLGWLGSTAGVRRAGAGRRSKPTGGPLGAVRAVRRAVRAVRRAVRAVRRAVRAVRASVQPSGPSVRPAVRPSGRAGGGRTFEPRATFKPRATFEMRATLFRYLWYLMYLVPEVPVGPVVPENLISDILVSPPFQKYITPMVNIEN